MFRNFTPCIEIQMRKSSVYIVLFRRLMAFFSANIMTSYDHRWRHGYDVFRRFSFCPRLNVIQITTSRDVGRTIATSEWRHRFDYDVSLTTDLPSRRSQSCQSHAAWPGNDPDFCVISGANEKTSVVSKSRVLFEFGRTLSSATFSDTCSWFI